MELTPSNIRRKHELERQKVDNLYRHYKSGKPSPAKNYLHFASAMEDVDFVNTPYHGQDE